MKINGLCGVLTGCKTSKKVQQHQWKVIDVTSLAPEGEAFLFTRGRAFGVMKNDL
ncbi:MAG TPA: hypothetical protein VEZ17_05870 [Chitinophagaceae bacterium]|jgi:hypothetical protein|nr:hypothetical protein [Chitinophagaceae bacterium]